MKRTYYCNFYRDLYGFEYDEILGIGNVFALAKNINEELKISGEVASKINVLLGMSNNLEDSQWRYGSNCHLTANYVSGISNDLGKLIGEEIVPWNHGVLLEIEKNKSQTFRHIEEAIEHIKFPFLLRMFSGEKAVHSVVVLGKLGKKYIGFDQKGFGMKVGQGGWGFCDLEKSLDKYMIDKFICSPIENP